MFLSIQCIAFNKSLFNTDSMSTAYFNSQKVHMFKFSLLKILFTVHKYGNSTAQVSEKAEIWGGGGGGFTGSANIYDNWPCLRAAWSPPPCPGWSQSCRTGCCPPQSSWHSSQCWTCPHRWPVESIILSTDAVPLSTAHSSTKLSARSTEKFNAINPARQLGWSRSQTFKVLLF